MTKTSKKNRQLLDQILMYFVSCQTVKGFITEHTDNLHKLSYLHYQPPKQLKASTSESFGNSLKTTSLCVVMSWNEGILLQQSTKTQLLLALAPGKRVKMKTQMLALTPAQPSLLCWPTSDLG